MRWAAILVFATACRLGFENIDGTIGATGDASGASDSGPTTTVPIDAAPGTMLPALVADSFLMGTDATPNGGDIYLQCGRYSGSGANMWAVFRFDLTGVPSNVQTATLRLYEGGPTGSLSLAMEIYRITQTWDEATVDWNQASTGVSWAPGGAISTNTYATGSVQLGTPGFYDWDITTLVNEWTSGAQPNDGFEMQYVTQPPTGNYVLFSSKENPNPSQHPQLLITP